MSTSDSVADILSITDAGPQGLDRRRYDWSPHMILALATGQSISVIKTTAG